MFNRKFKIGTRTSPLALKQVDEAAACIREFYLGFNYEAVGIETRGDKDKITSISDMEGSDFFTREIDEALLVGEIDFAVHSAKDLPDILPKGLVIAAMTRPLDKHDALVSKNNLKIDELPYGARIGASSKRRKEQLKRFRKDLQVADIRGNVNERLQISEAGELDGIIVAACALLRLGLGHKITEMIPFEILKPHPLQGSLALVVRSDKADLIEALSKIGPSSESLICENRYERD